MHQWYSVDFFFFLFLSYLQKGKGGNVSLPSGCVFGLKMMDVAAERGWGWGPYFYVIYGTPAKCSRT